MVVPLPYEMDTHCEGSEEVEEEDVALAEECLNGLHGINIPLTFIYGEERLKLLSICRRPLDGYQKLYQISFMAKILLALLLFSVTSFAQLNTFFKSGTDAKFETITPIDSGRYIVGGGNFFPSVSIIDTTGSILAHYAYNGLGGPLEYCRFFPTTDTGGLLIMHDGSANSSIVKVDKNLQPQWSKSIANTKIVHAQENVGGDIMLSGLKNNSGFVAKIDIQGNFHWSHVYTHSQLPVWFNSLTVIDSTGYLCVGVAHNDVILMRIDTAGAILWSKKFIGVGMATNTLKNSIGVIVFAGCSVGLNVDVIRIDTSGNIISNTSYDFSETVNDLYTHSIASTLDGGYIVTGANTNGFMVKTDSLGSIIWSKKYGALADHITQSVEQIDGGYIAVGYTHVYLGIHAGDFLRTDTAGNAGVCDSIFSPSPLSPLVVADTIHIVASTVSIIPTPVQITRSNSFLSFQDTCQTPWGSVEEVSKDVYRLFPNPAQDHLALKSHEAVEEILIYDQLGRIIFRKTIQSKASTIDVSHLLPGVYFYRIRFENDGFANGKIVIE